MNGIITSMVRPCALCVGSVVAGVTIFCCAHMEAPTRSARIKFGDDRFIPRKWLFNGSAE